MLPAGIRKRKEPDSRTAGSEGATMALDEDESATASRENVVLEARQQTTAIISLV